MGSSERKARHREEIRKLILQKSMEIIASEGLEKFTIRLLAERIEYSPRTVYLYYRDKAALLDAVTEHVFGMTVEEINKSGSLKLPPENVAGMMIERHLRNALAQPFLYEAVVGNINSREHLPGNSEKKLESLVAGLIESFISPGMEKLAGESAELLLCSLRSAALLLIKKSGGMSRKTTESYIELCRKTLIGGLK